MLVEKDGVYHNISPDTPDYINELMEIYFSVEGKGIVNDPDDVGGLTNTGLTKATADRLGVENFEKLTPPQVFAIVYNEFCVGRHINYINDSRIRTLAFLSEINLPSKNAYYVQKLISKMKGGYTSDFIDGHFGPETVAAINTLKDSEEDEFLAAYEDMLLAHYESRVRRYPKQAKFLNGWKNRIAQINRFNKELIV